MPNKVPDGKKDDVWYATKSEKARTPRKLTKAQQKFAQDIANAIVEEALNDRKHHGKGKK